MWGHLRLLQKQMLYFQKKPKKYVDILIKMLLFAGMEFLREQRAFLESGHEFYFGGVAERSNATDCKSVDLGLRKFKSFPLHHFYNNILARNRQVFAGVAQW